MKTLSKRTMLGLASAALLTITVGVTAVQAGAESAPAKEVPPADAKPKFEAHDEPSGTRTQQLVAQRLTEVLDRLPQDKRTVVGPTQLALGSLGYFGSAAEGYKVHLAQGADVSALTEKLTAGLPEDASKYLSFVKSDLTTQRVQTDWQAIQDGKWRTSGDESWTIELDSERPGIVVSTSPLSTQAEANLRAIDPTAIRVSVGASDGSGFSRASRTNDSTPHWGGAVIGTYAYGDCTAGWAARGKSTGTQYSVTAGHCAPNGTDMLNNGVKYGELVGKYDFPDYDQARLLGSTYAPYLYTNGPGGIEDNFSTRGVTGGGDGSVGQFVCSSGYYRGSACEIETLSLSASVCDRSGCTTNLGKGRREDAKQIVLDGDSGGPVYRRNTSNYNAAIRGLIVGYDDNGRTMFWERYESISNHLNVVVATVN